jgi:hypothetical protein
VVAALPGAKVCDLVKGGEEQEEEVGKRFIVLETKLEEQEEKEEEVSCFRKLLLFVLSTISKEEVASLVGRHLEKVFVRTCSKKGSKEGGND